MIIFGFQSVFSVSENPQISIFISENSSNNSQQKFWNELKSGAKDAWQFEEFYDSNQKFKYGIGLIKRKNT